MSARTLIPYLAPLGATAAVLIALVLVPAPAPATPDELAETAVARIKVGQPTRGLALLERALAQEPRHYRANFVASAYYVQTKQYGKAAPYLKAALAARQDDPELLFMLGVACQQQERYVEAESWYQRARAKAPTDPKIAYNLGMLHIIVMSYPKAKTYLEEYLRLAPQASDRAYVRDKIQQINQRIGGADD